MKFLLLTDKTPVKDRVNSVFMGTFVINGNSKALVITTVANTELVKISHGIIYDTRKETEFKRGVRRFGYFLMAITLILVISILVINLYFGLPVLESFLFSLVA